MPQNYSIHPTFSLPKSVKIISSLYCDIGTCKILNVEASSAASVNASQAKISTGTLDASSGATITVTEATDTPYKTDKSSDASNHLR